MKFSWIVLCVVCLLPEMAFAQLKHGDSAIRVVGTNAVNVRSEPRTGPNTLITKIKRGTLMKRLSKKGTWYQVLLPDGREAWMSGRYAEEVVARDLLEVTKATVNVRSSPSTAARRVGKAKKGDMLSMLRERNGWFNVILSNGSRGWVRNDMVIRHPLSPPDAKKEVPKSNVSVKPTPPKPKPVDHYQVAKDLVVDGKISDAIDAFKKALAKKPNDANIHFDLAKIYKQENNLDEALAHFRNARKSGGRDEAKFYIEDILKIRAAKAQGEEPAEEAPPEVVEEVFDENAADATSMAFLLPWILVGGVVFVGVLGIVVWRRRQALKPDQPNYRRRNQEAGFDSVLKYAVEKRPLFRAIEEAERKRSELDETLQQRLSAFGGAESPRLPSGESSEALLKKIEDLRRVIVNQEERAQIYADLIVLQNEKLSTLDEEVDALKKLIQIDYQEEAAKKQAKDGK
ncbi:MAG: SH3 domain-containing protein [Candidatus Latescibacteria bacterium]|nr:SH3 domain-containing protein [Candidatus Latescibacterota bacterium]